MLIKKEYQKSITKKVVDFLFSNNLRIKFVDSITGKITSKIHLPFVAEISLVFVLFIIIYKGLLLKYFSLLGSPYLIPAILLVGLIFCNKKYLIFRKYHFWYLGFLLISAVSMIFAKAFGISNTILFSGFYIFAQFFIVLLVSQSSKKKALITNAIIWLPMPVFIYGIWQIFSGIDTSGWFSSFESGGVRAFGFFGNPNVFGILASMVCIFSLGLFLEKKNKVYLTPVVLGFLAAGFSFSRSAWLGLVASLFIIFSIYFKKLFWQTLILPLVAFIIPKIRERILVIFRPDFVLDSSLDGRIWSFINGRFLWLKRPILGWGPGSYGGEIAASAPSPVYLEGIQNGYTALYYADNQYIEILVQVGIMGIIAFLGFVVSLFARLVTLSRKRNYYALGALGAIIVFFIAGGFANVLEFSALAIPAGILIGVTEDEK